MSHYSHLQPDVLCRLFKSYCCSFYGSFLWQYNSKDFEKMCITWNKAVRKMYSLPYHTHRWILGPLTNQRHIKYQLFARVITLLYSIIGYEPADLTVHPPPKTVEGGFIFFV